MHKKTHVTIHLEAHEKARVKKGDEIKRGQTLLASKPVTIHEFNLVRLLGISPKNLHRVLKVSAKKQVSKGDTLAQKNSLFSKQVLLSPVAGEFTIVDEHKGIVGVKETHEEKQIVAWFDGIIEEVTDRDIVVGVTGVLITGKSGKGSLASGTLCVILGNVDSFGIPSELEQTILVVKHATSDMIAKADTLGTVAIFSESIEEPKFRLPYLLVSDINDIHGFNKKNALLYGDKLELLILEDVPHHNEKTKHESHKNS